jgi:ABC-type phosphate transport system permease subunit
MTPVNCPRSDNASVNESVADPSERAPADGSSFHDLVLVFLKVFEILWALLGLAVMAMLWLAAANPIDMDGCRKLVSQICPENSDIAALLAIIGTLILAVLTVVFAAALGIASLVRTSRRSAAAGAPSCRGTR